MRKTIILFFCLGLLFNKSGVAQTFEDIKIAVDSTEFKIGEQINFQIQIKVDSLYQLQFS